MSDQQLQRSRAKALGPIVHDIIKKHSRDTVFYSQSTCAHNVSVIPTGSLAIDRILGIGGYPKGFITEIYGTQASGKTTLALEAIAEAQKRGGNALFVDSENTLNLKYAKYLGIDMQRMAVAHPADCMQCMDLCNKMIASKSVSIVVIDSIAALPPKKPWHNSVSQSYVMSRKLNKMAQLAKSTDIVVLAINQVRDRIGVIFGNPETTPGSKTLKYLDSVILRIDCHQPIKDGKTVIGNTVRAITHKNKFALNYSKCLFQLIYNKGLSHSGELLTMGVHKDIIKNKNSFYSYGKTKLGHGYKNAKTFLNRHNKLSQRLAHRIAVAYHIPLNNR